MGLTDIIAKLPQELRLSFYVIGLYVCFIYWGYLQEKLTAYEYISDVSGNKITWEFAFSLNLLMAASAAFFSAIVEFFTHSPKQVNIFVFAKAAITCAAASPIGYEALKYISFPLMILTKSAKPVPLMLIGFLFFNKRYTWYKYASVSLLCFGCVLFSYGRKSKDPTMHPFFEQLLGVVLVGINLFLDGYTNNEQDRIFKTHKISGVQMMKFINIWQIFYILIYLAIPYAMWGENSELHRSVVAWLECKDLRFDIVLFCVCASIGQWLIFTVMQEFGSLTWITVSITRKLFTVLISVFTFDHVVKPFQWFGVALVFTGLGLDVVMGHFSNKKEEKSTKEE